MAEVNAASPFRVLVVDDNPLIRESVVFAVARLNEKVTSGRKLELIEAEDGKTAWEAVRKGPIDLLITDLYIPVMTGLQLIARIREDRAIAATKILAISASIEDARATSLGAGADHFLQKPLRLVEIMDAVARLLKLDVK